MNSIQSAQTTDNVNLTSKNPAMATFMSRFLAYMIDSFIILGFIVALIVTIVIIFYIRKVDPIYLDIPTLFISYFLLLALVFIASITYYVYLTSKYGQTLGKKILQIKVVSSTSMQNISWTKAVLREIFGKWASSMSGNLGFLWYFMSNKRQTWHDSIGKTYVVQIDTDGQIVYGGKEFYEEEPLKTFLPMIVMFVLFILYFIIVLVFIFSVGMSTSSSQDDYPLLDSYRMESREGGVCSDRRGIDCPDGLYCNYNKFGTELGTCLSTPNK